MCKEGHKLGQTRGGDANRKKEVCRREVIKRWMTRRRRERMRVGGW